MEHVKSKGKYWFSWNILIKPIDLLFLNFTCQSPVRVCAPDSSEIGCRDISHVAGNDNGRIKQPLC